MSQPFKSSDELRIALRDCYLAEDKARKEWDEIVRLDMQRFTKWRVDLLNQIRAANALDEK